MENSILQKRFGPETINFFAGSTLNRFSFKRTESEFLSKCILHSEAKFLTFNNLDPLATKDGKLVLKNYAAVKAIIGNPYEISDEEKIKNWSAQDDQVIVIFLGCDESKSSEELKEGQPFFAIDVGISSQDSEADKAKASFLKLVESEGLEFKNVRVGVKLDQSEGAYVAMSRSLIDWNQRYQFCNGCGGKTISVWAGAKRQCPEKDRVNGARSTCISRKGLHNFSYPRTDSALIMGILSEDGERILLGRNKVWPRGMYSCLAGFLEPGESLEEAVRREVWEESGVQVGRVQYHSSQPWPFPSNLMIGCIGQALPGSVIDLGNDPELEDARWFSRADLHGAGIMGVDGQGDKEKEFSIPPEMAIANKLIGCFIRDEWELTKIK